MLAEAFVVVIFLCSQLVLSLLPFAVIIHLLLAVWMYGDPDNLVSEPVDFKNKKWEAYYNDFLHDHSNFDKIGLVPKLLRENVFSVAALLVFYVVVMRIVWPVIVKPLVRIIRCAMCFMGSV